MVYVYYQVEMQDIRCKMLDKGEKAMQTIRSNPAFGANIRKLRNGAHLTQEQVAARLQLRGHDINRSIYSQIECGIHHIRVEELMALKEIFDVCYDDFFTPLEKK